MCRGSLSRAPFARVLFLVAGPLWIWVPPVGLVRGGRTRRLATHGNSLMTGVRGSFSEILAAFSQQDNLWVERRVDLPS